MVLETHERGAVVRCCEKQDFLFSSSSDIRQLKLHQTTASRWGPPVAWADLAARSCSQSLHLPPNTLPQQSASRHTATGQVDSAGWCGRNLDSFSHCHPGWSEGWSHLVAMWFPDPTQGKMGWEKGRGQAGHLGNCSPPDWLSYKDHNTPSPPILVFGDPTLVFHSTTSCLLHYTTTIVALPCNSDQLTERKDCF